MNPKAQRIFEEVVDLPADEQKQLVAHACRGDEAMRREVESLLESHFQAGEFLSDPSIHSDMIENADAETATDPSFVVLSERPGDVIGRYRLEKEIGAGGFGVVFLAEQTAPVRRRVALKIIRLGMDTRDRIARFEAERQALAMMDHPSIARVLDAGATATGRLYFVMELVDGCPITQYCDRENLGIEARLGLFQLVCSAVQHAHQKGIIHRDIKPSNVLVTIVDGQPVPKVIDFGIAKAVNVRLTEKTLLTESRQVIGTPAYMSPEQADSSTSDIDTRSDVYSLGVLLYELLTGVTPFDFSRGDYGGLHGMQRIIQGETPLKPSVRISKHASAAAAAPRGNDPRILSGMIRGDLDWIVMKCLEKDRARRYQTAQAIADDVRRCLSNEPVLAGPPSAAYRISKFYRRHQAPVLVAGAFTAVVLSSVVGLALTLERVTEQRNKSVRAQGAALVTNAKLGLALLSSLNTTQGQIAKDTILQPMLELSGEVGAAGLESMPRIEQEIRTTLVVCFESLDEQDRAKAELATLLAVADTAGEPTADCRRRIAEDLHRHAISKNTAGDPEASERILKRALAYLDDVGDADTVRYAIVRTAYGARLSDLNQLDAARRELEAAYAVLARPDAGDERALAEVSYNLAVVRRSGGDPHGALDLADKAKSLYENDPAGLANCLVLLMMIHHDLGDFDGVEKLALEAQDHATRWPDSEHRIKLLPIYSNVVLFRPRTIPKWKEEIVTLLKLAERAVPKGNPEVCRGMMAAASCYLRDPRSSPNLDEAEKWLRAAYELGRTHPDWPTEATRKSKTNLIGLYKQQKRFAEAVDVCRELVALDALKGYKELPQSKALLDELLEAAERQ